MIYIQTNRISPVQKIVATLLGLTALVVCVLVSVVVLPVVAIAGLIGFGYVYWKTRALRKAMAEVVRDHGVIEGEAVVIREQHDLKHRN
jgi:hypothetical protein